MLPGSERPGWDGTTWVDLGSFRYARDPKWLRDGGLLVAPRDVPSDLMSITAHGTSPARVEVTSTWYALPWFTTGPLHLRDGRILDDRVRAHDRNSCGSISVVRRNSERELLRDATFRIRALSTLQRPDLSAVRRDNPEWTRPFAALTGQPLQFVTGQQGRLWTPDCLPIGTYEVEVRHPRYRRSASAPACDLGTAKRLASVGEMDADEAHTRRTSLRQRDCLESPRQERARHAVSGATRTPARRTSIGALCCRAAGRFNRRDFLLPRADRSRRPHPLETLVHNESLRLWRIVLAPERMQAGDEHGTRPWRLELFDTAGQSAGVMECFLSRGEARV